MKWDVHPDKSETYLKWTESAVKRTVAAPGVVELWAYRPATGTSQIAITYEFADMVTWTKWYDSQDVQNVLKELRTLALNVVSEV